MAKSEAVWRMTKGAYGWVCGHHARQIRKKAGLWASDSRPAGARESP